MTRTGLAHDSGVHDALRDQLVARLPPTMRIRAHGWRPWASACFAGARHWFEVTPAGDQPALSGACNWAELEWPLPGSFVADAAVEPGPTPSADWRITLLSVDD